MNMPQRGELYDKTQAVPDSTRLIEDVASGIGKLSVELADVLGNIHDVADRVSGSRPLPAPSRKSPTRGLSWFQRCSRSAN